MIKLILFFLLYFCTLSTAQLDDISGIKFNSKNVEHHLRTSVLINEGNYNELGSSFSVSFDIAFWNTNYIGPIFRISDENDNEYKIIFRNTGNVDSAAISVIPPLNSEQLDIRFLRRQLVRNKWFNIQLTFRQNSDIELLVDQKFSGSISNHYQKSKRYKISFGIKDINDYHDFDIPGIYLKNILITNQNEKKYFWSLNQSDSPERYESNGEKLSLLNHGWVADDHKVWREIGTIRTISQLPHSGITYDHTKSRLIIDGVDRIIFFDIISNKYTYLNISQSERFLWNDLLYDDKRWLLYSIYTGMGPVNIFDIKTNRWILNHLKDRNIDSHFGSAKFSYPGPDDLFLLGGYGYNKFNNDLSKYDFDTGEWEKQILTKNEMTPRGWFSIGNAFNDGEYFIFGGVGNETGIQEHGVKTYTDLYLFSFADLSISQINSIKPDTLEYAFLGRNLYLDKEDSLIYFLAKIKHGDSFPVLLKRLDLKSGGIITIADTILYATEHWDLINLVYSEATNEIISFYEYNSEIKIFAINYPPIENSVIDSGNASLFSSKIFLLPLLIFISLAGVILSVYLIRKRNNRKFLKNSTIKKINSNGSKSIRNYIQLFGGFHIFNSRGDDIISQFPPRLKEIFLLILLKSINHQQLGITSEELSTIIWPDSSPENVKSSRGVAINRIRKILSELAGLTLEFENRHWIINIDADIKCDFKDYTLFKETEKVNNGSKADVYSLLEILKGGEFLREVSYEWLDAVKISVNSEIIKLLRKQLDKEQAKSDPELLLKILDTILNFDSVDQDAIKRKVKFLFLAGDQFAAKNAYSMFLAEYERVYDEKFPFSFQEIISK